MAEARERAEWRRTSRLMWIFAAGNLKKRSGGSFEPDDFDPYASQEIVGEISAVELGEMMRGAGR